MSETPEAPAPTPKTDGPDPPAAWLVYRTPIQDFVHSADGKSAGTILVATNVRFTQSCSACHRG